MFNHDVSKRTALYLLLAILLLGAALRFWHLNYGLPYIYHADEPTNFGLALTMVRNADLNPHFFKYPSLFFYVNAYADWLFMRVGGLLGTVQQADVLAAPHMLAMGVGRLDNPAFVVNRVTSALFGLGAVLIALPFFLKL